MFFAYIIIAFFALLLILLLIKWVQKALFDCNKARGSTPTPVESRERQLSDVTSIFLPPMCTTDEPARYAIIDFQTTGLCTTPGLEDRILQVAWLILSADLHLLDKQVHLVRQESLGSAEACRVHHISPEALQKYGQPEDQVMATLWSSVKAVPTLVFHNAEYDLAIWRGSLQRLSPGLIPCLEAKESFCTLTYVPEHIDGYPHYPSLVALVSFLSGVPVHQLRTDLPVAWRNVCLTYYCFKEIKALETGEM